MLSGGTGQDGHGADATRLSVSHALDLNWSRFG